MTLSTKLDQFEAETLEKVEDIIKQLEGLFKKQSYNGDYNGLVLELLELQVGIKDRVQKLREACHALDFPLP